MPILDLQRRMAQLGEIRMGHAVATGRTSEKTGKATKRPEKLDRFRFTSPSQPLLEQIAQLYGGTVQPWTPQNGDPDEFEVYTTTNRVPVLVPPNAISQWYELYQGSRCIRRCDGQTEQKADKACVCDPEQRACSLTTRLNVMLRDVQGIGVWLLTTHGYYAAVELPPMAELLAQVGGYVEAWLTMEQKRVVSEVDGKPQTRQFMVPKLEIGITPAQLMAGQGSVGAPELAGQPQRQAIETGPTEAAPDYRLLARGATTIEELQELWRQAGAEGVVDDSLAQYLRDCADAIRSFDQPVPIAAAAADVDALWTQVMVAAPTGWTSTQVEDAYREFAGHHAEEATAESMAAFLEHLRSVTS